MIYYTADLHFGYGPVLEAAHRPFSSTEEMDEVLIENWNAQVTDQDTVYVLGDIGGHSSPFPHTQLSRLRGHKHLVRGNHDTGFENQMQFFDYFESVTDLLELDVGDTHLTLCHYPMVYNQGGYMIHGHLHNKQNELYDLLQKLPRVLNAGVDINGFAPVTLETLIQNNQIFYHTPEKGCPPTRKGSHKRKWKAVFQPLPIPKENFHEKA